MFALLFFSKNNREGIEWKSEVCSVKLCPYMSGYSNPSPYTMHHYLDIISAPVLESKNQPVRLTASLLPPKQTQAAHAWLDCVLLALQPFSFVENNIIRWNLKHSRISIFSFTKYHSYLTTHVKREFQHFFRTGFLLHFLYGKETKLNFLLCL